MKRVILVICFFINMYTQNLDFSDTLKFPLGTTSFKTFQENHKDITLDGKLEDAGIKILTQKLSEKNLKQYHFNKNNFKSIMYIYRDFKDSLRLATINKLNERYGLPEEKGFMGMGGSEWKFGKYQIISAYVAVAKVWIIALGLKDD